MRFFIRRDLVEKILVEQHLVQRGYGKVLYSTYFNSVMICSANSVEIRFCASPVAAPI